VSVGTNAELMNGRKMSGWENALAPSGENRTALWQGRSHARAASSPRLSDSAIRIRGRRRFAFMREPA